MNVSHSGVLPNKVCETGGARPTCQQTVREKRTKQGIRVTLVQNYMRSYMRVQKNYETTSPQLLEKYPDLAKIIGKSMYPYENSQNPDYERVPGMMRAGTDPFA